MSQIKITEESPISSSRELINPNTELTLDKKTNTYATKIAEPSNAALNKTVKLSSKRALLVLIALLLIGGAGGFAWYANRPVEESANATSTTNPTPQAKKLGIAVGLLEGLAQYSKDGSAWQDMTTETNLQEGDSVRTTGNGRAVLLIDDGSAIRLDANSEVLLSSLDAAAITVTQVAGQLYSRVVPSETRAYSVAVDDTAYAAKGTAYRTFNTDTKKGVEVFQSTVAAGTDKKEVPEGNYLFSKHDQADKQGTVMALDLDSLKNDDFIKWNSQQDKKVAEYATKLGILEELDKPVPTPVPAITPKPASSSGITLTGVQSEYSVVFNWKISGVDTSKGFKLVRSSKTQSPTYPDNSVAYIEAGKTSYTLYVGDGATYNYRLCAYREKTCDSYSNTVTVATAKKAKAVVEPGPITAQLAGAVLSWTIGGTAPYGYKVVVGTSSGPTYENNSKKYYTESTSYELPSYDFSAGNTYYLRVCKYSDSGCTDYSNEVVYTP